MAKYKVTTRCEVSTATEGYAPAGIATVTECVVEASGFMELAAIIQPIIAAANSVGVPVKSRL